MSAAMCVDVGWPATCLATRDANPRAGHPRCQRLKWYESMWLDGFAPHRGSVHAHTLQDPLSTDPLLVHLGTRGGTAWVQPCPQTWSR